MRPGLALLVALALASVVALEWREATDSDGHPWPAVKPPLGNDP